MKNFRFCEGVTKLAQQRLLKRPRPDIPHARRGAPARRTRRVCGEPLHQEETFFLPYIIEKDRREWISTRSPNSAFFSGGFGRYLESLGAISTRDPERDRTMTGGLLRGDHSCMIFPEGQMVKDKKLVEHGKYMIYNAGIRRPPHTGAGLLALRTEFYRAKLGYFLETGYEEGVNEYMAHFGIASHEKAVECARIESVNVPVNITYFPIRARNNIITGSLTCSSTGFPSGSRRSWRSRGPC